MMSTVRILIDGRSLDELGLAPLLRSVEVSNDRFLSSLLIIELRNVEGRFGKSKDLHEGAELKLYLKGKDEMVDVGTFDLARIRYRYEESSRIILTALGREFRMAREPKRRIFRKVADSDIATRIASDNGLNARITATQPTFEQVSQIDMSDLQLLMERAKRYGFEVFVKDDTLHFHALGQPEETFTYPYGSELVRRVELDEVLIGAGASWQVAGRDPFRNEAYRASPVREIATGGAEATRQEIAGALTRFMGDPSLRTYHEARQFVQALAQETAPFVAGEMMVSGEPIARPRHRVTLEDFEVMSGDYLVDGVTHVYEPGVAKMPFYTLFRLAREAVGRRKVSPVLERPKSALEIPRRPAENLVPQMTVEATVTE